MAVQETAATFLGINNENEFYSAHYLAEVFKGDMADIIKQWDEQAEQSKAAIAEGSQSVAYVQPNRALRNLHQAYFALRHRLKSERNTSERITQQREFFKALLDALGIAYQPQNHNLGPDLDLPLLANVKGKLKSQLPKD